MLSRTEQKQRDFLPVLFLFLQAIWYNLSKSEMQFKFSIQLKSLILACFVFSFLCLSSQEINPLDTAKIYDLEEIVVTEQFRNSELRAAAPLQILSSKKIEKLNVLQISDAIKHFSGVSVKDYGGIGGVKTVSVRSLGANHTSVAYDGISLSDMQTGQIDLSRFSLENIDMLSLNNGQSDNIFQAARLFASASVLNIRSLSPRFDEKQNIKGKAGFKVGSFGMFNPSAWIDFRLSEKLSASLSTESLKADGEYPYLLHYGKGEDDFSENRIRKNTDVNNFRIESALYANISENDKATIKAYYYQSERGLPDAAIYYRPESLSKQRVKDKSFFVQANYQKDFSRKILMQSNAKYNYGYFYYLNPHYQNSAGKEENTYIQHEYYLSASLLYRLFDRLSLSFSSDYFLNTMDADLATFAYPQRHTVLTVFAAKYVSEHFTAIANVLNTATKEKTISENTAENHFRFSPYLSFSYKVFNDQDFRIRFFYKNIFRLPTFNDLYYPKVGNAKLQPETTNQFNLGMNYSFSFTDRVPVLSFSADAYYNRIDDKIVAIASPEIFSVSMLNYGKVDIAGVDFTMESSISLTEKTALNLGANYTYQRALIKTDPKASDYLHQIPYTPRVSGSAHAVLETGWVDFSYSMLWSGHRYKLQNFAENRLPAYSDHSVSLSKNIAIRKLNLYLSAEALNIFDKNYEIILNYPMPGRSYRVTISLKF